MSGIPPLAKEALEQARRGEYERALSTAKQEISENPGDGGLRFFAAMLHSRRAEFEEAAAQLREAMRLAPGDPLVRAELARVLIGLGHLEEAAPLVESPGIPPQDSRRLRAMLSARRGG